MHRSMGQGTSQSQPQPADNAGISTLGLGLQPVSSHGGRSTNGRNIGVPPPSSPAPYASRTLPEPDQRSSAGLERAKMGDSYRPSRLSQTFQRDAPNGSSPLRRPRPSLSVALAERPTAYDSWRPGRDRDRPSVESARDKRLDSRPCQELIHQRSSLTLKKRKPLSSPSLAPRRRSEDGPSSHAPISPPPTHRPYERNSVYRWTSIDSDPRHEVGTDKGLPGPPPNAPRGPRGSLLAPPLAGPAADRVLADRITAGRTLPHIFIPSRHLPAADVVAKHLWNKLEIYYPKGLLMDREGYYVTFEDSLDGRDNLSACHVAERMGMLFGEYKLVMKAFPRGLAVKSDPRVDRNTSACIGPRKSDAAAGDLQQPSALANKPLPPLPASISPSRVDETNNEHVRQESAQRLAAPGNAPDTSLIEEFTSSAISPSAPLIVPSRQDHDDASSISGKTNTSVASAPQLKKCHVCKSNTERDRMLTCSRCPRRYHRRCHCPRLDSTHFVVDESWTCSRCFEKKPGPTSAPALPIPDTNPAPVPARPTVKPERPSSLETPASALNSVIAERVTPPLSRKKLKLAHGYPEHLTGKEDVDIPAQHKVPSRKLQKPTTKVKTRDDVIESFGLDGLLNVEATSSEQAEPNPRAPASRTTFIHKKLSVKKPTLEEWPKDLERSIDVLNGRQAERNVGNITQPLPRSASVHSSPVATAGDDQHDLAMGVDPGNQTKAAAPTAGDASADFTGLARLTSTDRERTIQQAKALAESLRAKMNDPATKENAGVNVLPPTSQSTSNGLTAGPKPPAKPMSAPSSRVTSLGNIEASTEAAKSGVSHASTTLHETFAGVVSPAAISAAGGAHGLQKDPKPRNVARRTKPKIERCAICKDNLPVFSPSTICGQCKARTLSGDERTKYVQSTPAASVQSDAVTSEPLPTNRGINQDNRNSGPIDVDEGLSRIVTSPHFETPRNAYTDLKFRPTMQSQKQTTPPPLEPKEGQPKSQPKPDIPSKENFLDASDEFACSDAGDDGDSDDDESPSDHLSVPPKKIRDGKREKGTPKISQRGGTGLGDSFKRPDNTYLTFIKMAMMDRPDYCVQGFEVVQWVEDNVPNYRIKDGTWANGVRATLSMHRDDVSTGHSLWTRKTITNAAGKSESTYTLRPEHVREAPHWDSVRNMPVSPTGSNDHTETRGVKRPLDEISREKKAKKPHVSVSGTPSKQAQAHAHKSLPQNSPRDALSAADVAAADVDMHDAPSLNPSHTVPRAVEKISRRGCLTCKRRHVKCDETPGRCTNCQNRGIECTYADVQALIDMVPKPAGIAARKSTPFASSFESEPASSSSDDEPIIVANKRRKTQNFAAPPAIVVPGNPQGLMAPNLTDNDAKSHVPKMSGSDSGSLQEVPRGTTLLKRKKPAARKSAQPLARATSKKDGREYKVLRMSQIRQDFTHSSNDGKPVSDDQVKPKMSLAPELFSKFQQLLKSEAASYDTDIQYSARSFFQEWPEYQQHDEKGDMAGKQEEIVSRLTRKQLFKQPALSSSLAVDDKKISEASSPVPGIGESRSRTPATPRKSNFNPMLANADFENGNILEFMTLDEFFDLPSHPLPVVGRKNGGNTVQLAYRDGTTDEKGELPRAKVLYKVGPPV